ncbi:MULTISPECIES: response regulator transcription factor [unclassified Planococcus (in: firmicutes)]|uniref:response regulator transcription factor n=1 Tax=unclassified Planococcus (in: firmicutes) TaxID=2662419 RepID=UPI000C348F57|nr:MULTISPECIES: response regulator transcription factor [unclassified Planococcus (in: firmicutes)]AUD14518.1 DNA-binding response regulator [Planococcus sp. MB-3u-03]PKG44801.1 DNA-binding response regulator [Planococcus sp. Urea-trap-24]PKG87143.1 DNA-binding response regulator [Planococcus sp. Urea-3u-39]PKH40247.1 DNA-binding response regulator [Planococcus sp. MB-3u-09]
MHKILLIDDEQRMLDLLSLYLTPHQYQCTKAQGPREALRYLETQAFDIVLLDIMMPEMSGFELCAKIRSFSDVPIIMLTAREQQEDIVKGLKLGADDYITKPFNEEELLARIEALLRRQAPKNIIEVGGLKWNEERFELSYLGTPIKLTPKEFFMVGQLVKNPGKVFSRDQLILLIWGYDSETEGRTIDSHVRNVREKIRQSGFPVDKHFLTVWGVGYKWLNEAE